MTTREQKPPVAGDCANNRHAEGHPIDRRLLPGGQAVMFGPAQLGFDRRAYAPTYEERVEKTLGPELAEHFRAGVDKQQALDFGRRRGELALEKPKRPKRPRPLTPAESYSKGRRLEREKRFARARKRIGDLEEKMREAGHENPCPRMISDRAWSAFRGARTAAGARKMLDECPAEFRRRLELLATRGDPQRGLGSAEARDIIAVHRALYLMSKPSRARPGWRIVVGVPLELAAAALPPRAKDDGTMGPLHVNTLTNTVHGKLEDCAPFGERYKHGHNGYLERGAEVGLMFRHQPRRMGDGKAPDWVPDMGKGPSGYAFCQFWFPPDVSGDPLAEIASGLSHDPRDVSGELGHLVVAARRASLAADFDELGGQGPPE